MPMNAAMELWEKTIEEQVEKNNKDIQLLRARLAEKSEFVGKYQEAVATNERYARIISNQGADIQSLKAEVEHYRIALHTIDALGLNLKEDKNDYLLFLDARNIARTALNGEEASALTEAQKAEETRIVGEIQRDAHPGVLQAERQRLEEELASLRASYNSSLAFANDVALAVNLTIEVSEKEILERVKAVGRYKTALQELIPYALKYSATCPHNWGDSCDHDYARNAAEHARAFLEGKDK